MGMRLKIKILLYLIVTGGFFSTQNAHGSEYLGRLYCQLEVAIANSGIWPNVSNLNVPLSYREDRKEIESEMPGPINRIYKGVVEVKLDEKGDYEVHALVTKRKKTNSVLNPNPPKEHLMGHDSIPLQHLEDADLLDASFIRGVISVKMICIYSASRPPPPLPPPPPLSEVKFKDGFCGETYSRQFEGERQTTTDEEKLLQTEKVASMEKREDGKAINSYNVTLETARAVWIPCGEELDETAIMVKLFLYQTSKRTGFDLILPIVGRTINGKEGFIHFIGYGDDEIGIFAESVEADPNKSYADINLFRFLVDYEKIKDFYALLNSGHNQREDQNTLNDFFRAFDNHYHDFSFSFLDAFLEMTDEGRDVHFFFKTEKGMRVREALSELNLDEIEREADSFLGEEYARYLIFNYLFFKQEFSIKPLPLLRPLSGREIDPREDFLKNEDIKDIEVLERGVLNVGIITFSDESVKGVLKPYRRFAYSRWVRAEIFAYEFSKRFEIALVPPTVERIMNGIRHSVQFFVEHHDFHDSVVPEDKLKGKDEELLMQEVFDAIILNVDRSTSNFFVSKDDELVSIDHHAAFFPSYNTNVSIGLETLYSTISYSDDLQRRIGKKRLTYFLCTDRGEQVAKKFKDVDWEQFKIEANTYLQDDLENHLREVLLLRPTDYAGELIERMQSLVKAYDDLNKEKDCGRALPPPPPPSHHRIIKSTLENPFFRILSEGIKEWVIGEDR